MGDIFTKSPLRKTTLIKLGFLYAGCFLLTGVLLFVERESNRSYVMMRFLRFLIDYQVAIILAFSVVVMIFHYQQVNESKDEVKCRIIVGDRLWLIRLRYAFACSAVLAICFMLSCSLFYLFSYSLKNCFYLLPVLVGYILLSALLLRAK
ncbi:hypothetical protein BK816_01155 [Boudabousia tangfeifanii]|uniref:Uncharacterized protein n=1 Tax=Boudabousia tangfeifanii TaxID=1912795 RepID=A0A1D9MIG4_9ACTO|nr:hypothetical protein BK816_01155 [Boudabousia tangfeifanii]